jgi:hypothetical protein
MFIHKQIDHVISFCVEKYNVVTLTLPWTSYLVDLDHDHDLLFSFGILIYNYFIH